MGSAVGVSAVVSASCEHKAETVQWSLGAMMAAAVQTPGGSPGTGDVTV